jgi:hypothetical protein
MLLRHQVGSLQAGRRSAGSDPVLRLESLMEAIASPGAAPTVITVSPGMLWDLVKRSTASA